MTSFWWFMMPVLNLWLLCKLGSLIITRHVCICGFRHTSQCRAICNCTEIESQVNIRVKTKAENKLNIKLTLYLYARHKKKKGPMCANRGKTKNNNASFTRKEFCGLKNWPQRWEKNSTERYLTTLSAKTSNKVTCPLNFASESRVTYYLKLVYSWANT